MDEVRIPEAFQQGHEALLQRRVQRHVEKGGLPKAPELGSSATSVETTPTLAAADVAPFARRCLSHGAWRSDKMENLYMYEM